MFSVGGLEKAFQHGDSYAIASTSLALLTIRRGNCSPKELKILQGDQTSVGRRNHAPTGMFRMDLEESFLMLLVLPLHPGLLGLGVVTRFIPCLASSRARVVLRPLSQFRAFTTSSLKIVHGRC